MEGKSKSGTKARLIVLAIFVVGFSAGALSMNLYHAAGRDKKNGRGPAAMVIKLRDELNLSNDQSNTVQSILQETNSRYGEIRKEMEPCLKEYRPRFDMIRQEGRDKIRQILSDSQRAEFEKMVEERDRKRENWNRDRGKQ